MKTLFAIFGLITLVILTLLTGGVGLILLLLSSESVRDFLAKAFADFVTSKMFGSDFEYDKEMEETEQAFHNAFNEEKEN